MSRRTRILSTLAAAIPLLLLAAFAWRNVVDLDFGIHMASGRWIVEEGRVPAKDPFTWTASDRDYVAYHWLFQAGTYGLYRALGIQGPTAARWAILMGTGLLIAAVLRMRSASPLAGAAIGVLAILASETRFRLRPELVSYGLAAATLWVLEKHRRGESGRLWLLPVLQLLWVNSHVYAFGWVILGVYLADELLRRRSLRTPLAAWSAASALALLANPYHLRSVLYPLYLATRMRADNVFARHITELSSPFAVLAEPGFQLARATDLLAYFALLALGVLALGAHLWRRRRVDAALLVLAGGLSLLAVRNVPFFAIVATPSLCVGLDDVARGLARRAPRLGGALAATGWAAALGVAALTVPRVVLGGYYAERERPERFTAGICGECLAVDAGDWLADHDLKGRGFNNLNIGATLLWRDPAHKVYIDGRNEVTGEAGFERYLRDSEPSLWDETTREYALEYATLAYRHDRQLSSRLLNGPGWKLVYLDGAAAVFVRRAGPNGGIAAARLPRPPRPAERERLLAAIRVEDGAAARLRRWLVAPDAGPGPDFAIGTWLLTLGHLEAAERPLLTAARERPSHAVTHNNLGVVYYRRGLWKEAARAFENLRALDPEHPSVALLPDIERRARGDAPSGNTHGSP